MENVILVDFDVSTPWDFHQGVEEATHEKWSIIKCVTNKLNGSSWKTLKRYARYFTFSFGVFLRRNKYKRVIAWQQFYGLILAFFCAVFRVKKAPEIYIMTFIYKPKKSRLYNWFIRYIVSSKYISRIIVLSDNEREYYAKAFSVKEDTFYSTHIGVEDLSEQIRPKNTAEKYYLAVGRSNRDYHFLREAWKREYGRLVVINESYKEEEKEGIEVLRNCYGDEYLQMVADCYAQIIPLEDENISSGSLSFLKAMMLSKPSIVTENKTVYDYITDKRNGIIIKKDPKALEAALNYIREPETYAELCSNARADYLERFSARSLGVDIGKMISRNYEK